MIGHRGHRNFRRMFACGLSVLFISVFVAPVSAHHSFAVHYDGDSTRTLDGTVENFRFRNPHGMILLKVETGGPDDGLWRIETNSPNILRRRGWSPDSLRAGDSVTIVGFPARDGSQSMRVFRVTFTDGTELIGQRPAAGLER